MKLRTFFSKNSGFSILSVLVGAGLMGGLAMYLASVTKKQHTTQRVAETGAALTELHHKILSVLYDSESCTKTLVDTGFGGNDRLYDGRPLQDLKNKDGDAVVQVGAAGRISRMLEVESMIIRGIRGGAETKEANLLVTIKKLGEANAGKKTVKSFPLTVEMKSASPPVIARCHHTLDAKEHGIKKRMCLEMGGVMIPVATGSTVTRCSIDNLYEKFCDEKGGNYSPSPAMKCDINPVLEKFCTDMNGSWSSGQCSVTPILQTYCTSLGGTWTGSGCDIEPVYVDVSGDTMTGPLSCTNLSCTGNLDAGGKVISGGGGGTPTPVNPTTCGPGQTGTPPNCVASACGPGQTGTPPNCTCASGIGTPPNCCSTGETWDTATSTCVASACPAGQTGTPPNCTCASGIGTPPNCCSTGQTWDTATSTCVAATNCINPQMTYINLYDGGQYLDVLSYTDSNGNTFKVYRENNDPIYYRQYNMPNRLGSGRITDPAELAAIRTCWNQAPSPTPTCGARQTGIPPNCTCASGYTGTPPNCCPTGQTWDTATSTCVAASGKCPAAMIGYTGDGPFPPLSPGNAGSAPLGGGGDCQRSVPESPSGTIIGSPHGYSYGAEGVTLHCNNGTWEILSSWCAN